jgi:hypothetical protein
VSIAEEKLRMTRRARAIEGGWVACGSLLSAGAFTWPLVLHLQTRARDQFDTLLQAWTIDWVQYAVVHGQNPYNARIFRPEQTTLAYSDTLIGVAIPTLPFRWLGLSPIGVLNVTLLLGFAASAAGAYVLVRLVTGSRMAAAVGGAVYAYGPFGALAARHVHVAVRPGVPLAAAAAWWFADRARGNGRLSAPVTALVAVVAWQGTVSFYPATYAVLTAAVVLLVRLGSLGRRGILAGAASLLAAGASLAVLALPNLAVSARDPHYGFSLSEFGVGSANFTHTEPGLVVWGRTLGLGPSDSLRNAVFPGAILLILAVLGVLARGRRTTERRMAARAGLALTVAGVAIAVGTSATGWRQYAPYRLLYEIGPPFSALRATARGWMIGLCGLGLLAGLGALALEAWIRRRLRVPNQTVAVMIGTVVVLLILLEGYDPWFNNPTARVAPVDVELARSQEPGGVVYLPMNSSERLDISIFSQPANLYGDTEHHRPTPNGYSGYVPPSYIRQSRTLWKLPTPEALTLLRRLGVRFVVVHPSVAGGPWASLRSPRSAEPLRYLGRFGRDLLYEVPSR